MLIILLISCRAIAGETWMLRSEMEEAIKNMKDSFSNINTLQGQEINEVILRNVTLKVIVHEMIPYTLFVRDGNRRYITGYIGEVWNVLQNKLQFRSEYRKTSFRRGKEILAAGIADIMLSPVVFDAKDLDDFDIGGPVATTIYSVYFKAPDDIGSSSSYLWTWSRSLWISYTCVLMLCTLLLYLMTNIRSTGTRETKNTISDARGATVYGGFARETTCLHLATLGRKKWFGMDLEKSKNHSTLTSKGDSAVNLSLGNCFLVILGAATQQDVQIRTKVCSLRALLVVLLIFNHLMMTSYTSVLTSRLTVSNSHTYFTTLQSIPDMGSVYLGMRTNSAIISMFQTNESSEELLPRWSGVINKGPCHPNPISTEDMASNICKDQCLIFESDNIMSRLLASRHDCDMIQFRPRKIFSQVSILFKKHLPYRRILRSEILNMKNAGILDALEERFLFEKRKSQGPPKYQEVTLGHVKALVLVYAAAAFSSCFLLALELATRKCSAAEGGITRKIFNTQFGTPHI